MLAMGSVQSCSKWWLLPQRSWSAALHAPLWLSPWFRHLTHGTFWRSVHILPTFYPLLHVLTQIFVLAQITGSCSSPVLSDPLKYSRLFRTISPDTSVVPARFKVMEEFHWSKFATVHEPANLFSSVSLLHMHFSKFFWKACNSSNECLEICVLMAFTQW